MLIVEQEVPAFRPCSQEENVVVFEFNDDDVVGGVSGILKTLLARSEMLEELLLCAVQLLLFSQKFYGCACVIARRLAVHQKRSCSVLLVCNV